MKNNSTLGVTVLALAAVGTNFAPLGGGAKIEDRIGQACAAPSEREPHLDPWMTDATFLAGNCDDCVLVDTIPEGYCESRGTDCDGLFGWNESYYWYREKKIYECGTPGQPGYGFFIECTIWDRDGCCDDGTTGLPPTNCSYQGADLCANRPIGPGQ
jgi:hypothetical protein